MDINKQIAEELGISEQVARNMIYIDKRKERKKTMPDHRGKLIVVSGPSVDTMRM